ncbi:MAG: hypothetical protein ABI607_04830 [Betaproteobacteria bacterium]
MRKPPVGRRQLLAAVGALGVIPLVNRGRYFADAMAAPAPPVTGLSCVLSPAMTEGPYFIDGHLNRSDLTVGTTRPSVVQGLPLVLNLDLKSVQTAGCLPAAGMQVDVWHADATGEYSGIADGASPSRTRELAWLRGSQASDANVATAVLGLNLMRLQSAR